MADKVKVLVVDDLAFMRRTITDIVNSSKKNEILERIKMAGILSKSLKVLPEKVKSDEIYLSVQKGDKCKKNIRRSEIIKSIVAIGVSTGGPKSLMDVIPYIPGDIPAAIFITQHMPPGFTRSLAERLDSASELIVKEAEADEIVKPGYANIAPGNNHMTIKKGNIEGAFKIRLLDSQPVNGHKPSVDVMMSSIAKTGYKSVIAVIMTGMGRDGSEGMKKIKELNGGYSIAQDEKTCIVYGMPKSAIETGMVDVIVPLKDIAKEITKVVGVHQ